jgi:CheY-like chemotaxis protein
MQPIHILLVEDNEGDELLIREAFQEIRLSNEIRAARDGQMALAMLSREGEYAGTELPDLVILDINLPKKNGHEVLRFIKQNDSLKHLPVIMFTTSSADEDVRSAYTNYANCYIVKPFDAADFINTVIQIENFWFNIVKLPPQ